MYSAHHCKGWVTGEQLNIFLMANLLSSDLKFAYSVLIDSFLPPRLSWSCGNVVKLL